MLKNGLNTELEATKIERFRTNQKDVLIELKLITGSEDWPEITKAGFMVVDRECQQYMTLLYQLNKAKKEVGSQMNLFSTATVALQGLLEESAKTISITGAGLGLLQGAWRNYRSSLLYELEPEAVKGLVGKLQDSYKGAFILADVSSRTDSFTGIYNYAELCTPIKISLEISNSIQAAQAQPTINSDSSSNEKLKISVDPNQQLR